MKKYVSLFLALLMMCSVLFAIPAEVNAAFVKEQVEESAKAPCACGEAHCAEELYQPGDSVMYVPGDSSCSHTYKLAQWNASQHKKYCTKCGYAVFYNHSLKYTSGGDKCKKTCSCGYSVVVGNHVWGSWQQPSSTMHKRYCTRCGTIQQGCHTNFRNYVSKGSYHNATCGVCGKVVTQNHVSDKNTYNQIIGNDEYHYTKCKDCLDLYKEPHQFKKITSPDGATQIDCCVKCGYMVNPCHP